MVFTGRNAESVNTWAELARGPYYHVFTSGDPVGTEVCAALKNAYAMGIGFAAGLHEKSGGSTGSIAMHNCEAALYAQAILEAKLLVDLLGGDPECAAGLPFAGDLNVTCNGGRTGRFGRFLGQGLGRAGAISAMNGATLECLEILETLRTGLCQLERNSRITPGRFAIPLTHAGGRAGRSPSRHPLFSSSSRCLDQREAQRVAERGRAVLRLLGNPPTRTLRRGMLENPDRAATCAAARCAGDHRYARCANRRRSARPAPGLRSFGSSP